MSFDAFAGAVSRPIYLLDSRADHQDARAASASIGPAYLTGAHLWPIPPRPVDAATALSGRLGAIPRRRALLNQIPPPPLYTSCNAGTALTHERRARTSSAFAVAASHTPSLSVCSASTFAHPQAQYAVDLRRRILRLYPRPHMRRRCTPRSARHGTGDEDPYAVVGLLGAERAAWRAASNSRA